MSAITPHESDVDLASGRVRIRDHGGEGRLVLCVPGLSANATTFDRCAEQLAGRQHHVVSLDLRGRGRSPATPAGTYGWPAHGHDVLELASRLAGDTPVDLVGHSMGAYVVMAALGEAPAAVRRAVLIDGAGRPDPACLPPILEAVERLGTVRPTVEDYIARVRALGTVTPWSPYWQRYFEYELEEVEGGVRARTDRDAVLEDVRWGADHDQRDLWAALRGPVLLVRALRPVGATSGFVVGERDRDAFAARVPGAQVVEVDANHYGIVNDDATAGVIAGFLAADG